MLNGKNVETFDFGPGKDSKTVNGAYMRAVRRTIREPRFEAGGPSDWDLRKKANIESIDFVLVKVQ